MDKRNFMTEQITQTYLNENGIKPDEADLIEAVRKDPKAFGQLYCIYVQPIFRYLYSRIGSIPEAEDVTTQTFLAALEGLSRYRHDGHFAAWLYGIARRKAMDHFRSQRKQAPLEYVEHIPVQGDLLQDVIRSDQNVALARLINSLPENERELIRLRYIAELSFAEIGRLLNRSEGAVKKSLYRLLARFQGQLEVLHE
jgi:RNA polymerase sigma-70 factor (ECF subfamily)